MSIPAWRVINWAPVQIKLRDFQRTCAAFQHLGTSVHQAGDGGEPRCGQALWGAERDGQLIGVAFEWAEMTGEIVALSDPMQILSNVKLLQDDGECMDDLTRIVQLNTAIHELDWQQQIPARAARFSERLAA
jgi:hypothetical protein